MLLFCRFLYVRTFALAKWNYKWFGVKVIDIGEKLISIDFDSTNNYEAKKNGEKGKRTTAKMRENNILLFYLKSYNLWIHCYHFSFLDLRFRLCFREFIVSQFENAQLCIFMLCVYFYSAFRSMIRMMCITEYSNRNKRKCNIASNVLLNYMNI